jgi:Tol biopolymer transport system component
MRHLPAPINSDKYEYGPSISPDGQWLFLTSARAGTADIYRMPVSVLKR